MRRLRNAVALGGVALAVGAALAGCTSAPAVTVTPGAGNEVLSVVASTDVYGSLASAVGGDLVHVTSIIDDPSKDPHEYEASARDQLAVRDADLVIENGAGYDDFLTTLVSASGGSAVVISAADVVGAPADGNEHLWYDVTAMAAVVDELASRLGEIDPEDSAVFDANASSAKDQLEALADTESDLADTYRGQPFLATEALPLPMLTAIGLVDQTPPGVQDAIERGSEIPAGTFLQAVEIVTSGEPALVAFNEQTPTAQANALVENAKTVGVPTVGLSETLPKGDDYFTWMKANLDRITEALAR